MTRKKILIKVMKLMKKIYKMFLISVISGVIAFAEDHGMAAASLLDDGTFSKEFESLLGARLNHPLT